MGSRAQTSELAQRAMWPTDNCGMGGHVWMLFALCFMGLEVSLFTVAGVWELLHRRNGSSLKRCSAKLTVVTFGCWWHCSSHGIIHFKWLPPASNQLKLESMCKYCSPQRRCPALALVLKCCYVMERHWRWQIITKMAYGLQRMIWLPMDCWDRIHWYWIQSGSVYFDSMSPF